MTRKIITVGAMLLFGAALFSGCAKDPASVGEPTDQEEILQLVQENEDYFTVAGLNDDGAQPVSYSFGDFSKVADLISPIRFGRRGRMQLQNVDIEYSEDGTAVATIVHSFNGAFFILAKDTTDTVAYGKLYKKEMENTITRRAIFRRNDQFQQGNMAGQGMQGHGGQGGHGQHGSMMERRGHGRRWHMFRISGSLAQSPETSLSFEWVKVTDGEQEWTIEDPLEFILDVEQIPVFGRMDTVKVYVKINNSAPYADKPGETVLLRYHNDRRMHRARRPFNDEGIYPDETAGDGIYSGMWVVRGHRGIFHAFVDAIDNGTIYDDQLPYNSLAWGFPYIVK